MHTLAAQQGNDFAVACDPGSKAISGGVDESAGTAVPLDTRPSADGGSWQIFLLNPDSANPTNGTVYAICLK